MPSIKDIITLIEDFAPLELALGWDNCGVQVSADSLEQQISSAVVALDPTMEVLNKAIEMGSKLIITHHPLTISGTRNITPQSELGRIIIKAIREGITIYSSHTAFDITSGGINDTLAQMLEIENCEPLCEDGLGRIGTLKQPTTSQELAQRLKSTFSLPSIRTNAHGDENISRIALCGGSGGSLIDQAKQNNADCYLCGDLKYHAFDQEDGLILFDIGHFESENHFLKVISDIISEKFTTFALYNINSSYTRYF